jgi:peptide chain release factor
MYCYMISKQKWQQLHDWMSKLDIEDSTLIEKFIIGSGSGGQKLHKTASTVYLKHIPSGVEVKCQQSRSREENRFYARRILCEKIDEMINHEKSKKKQLVEKIKRQKKRRSKRAKKKMLDDKGKRGILKETRKKPSDLN